jgi:hypothetical protein
MPQTPRIVLATGLSLAALSIVPSCSTKEISPDEGDHYFYISLTKTDTNPADVSFSVAPDADNWDQELPLLSAEFPVYDLKIDGRWAVTVDGDGLPWPIRSYSGGSFEWSNWIPAGSHLFELVDSNGKTALATTFDVRPDQANHLFVFGKQGALEHRLVSYTFDVPAGMVRYSAINLFRTGETIQLVKCDAPSSANCATPVSDPIAYGEVAGGDVIAEPGTLAYRITPAAAGAAVSAPMPLDWDMLAYELNPSSPTRPAMDPPVFVASPFMLESDGEAMRLN